MTTAPLRILCVDDEENVLRSLKRLFMDDPYEMLTASSGTDGLTLLRENPSVQIVLSDYRMPGMNGVDFLREVRMLCPDTVRIVLSGYADTSTVVAAINEGRIYKFIPKPWNDDELRVTIANAFERHALHEQNAHLAEELKKKNEELLAFNTILKERITEKIGDLEKKNKNLMVQCAMLRQLPCAVVGLTGKGLLVFYYNDQAMRLFSWNSPETLPHKRAELFSHEINTAIDELIADASKSKSICMNTMRIRMQCACLAPDEQGQTMIMFIQEHTSTSQ
ncbi:MAG: response regulator [Nitrospirota bacterium]